MARNGSRFLDSPVVLRHPEKVNERTATTHAGLVQLQSEGFVIVGTVAEIEDAAAEEHQKNVAAGKKAAKTRAARVAAAKGTPAPAAPPAATPTEAPAETETPAEPTGTADDADSTSA